jgi:hypothetical protein
MAKSIRDTPKKRGRPKTTGRGEGIMLRLHPPLLKNLNIWIANQADNPSRPEAIRRLVEQALVGKAAKRPSIKASARPAKAQQAAELAGRVIETKTDRSQPVEEQKSRKRKLISGPTEFRDMRRDQPKR